MSQNHLNKTQTVNLGSFYTPDYIVESAYKMFFNFFQKNKKYNLNDFVLLDSSCGYGNFLKIPTKYDNLNFSKKIGVDIDNEALKGTTYDFLIMPRYEIFKSGLITKMRVRGKGARVK